MILFCTGMQRSASTWSFNICLRLISAAFPDCRIQSDFSDDFAGVLNHLEDESPHVILKSHTLGPLARKLVALGAAKAVHIHRDPRAAVASCMLEANLTFEQAFEAVRESAELYQFHVQTGGCCVVTYSSVIERPEDVVRNISDYLGLSASEHIIRQITREMPLDTVSDVGCGSAVLTDEQQRIISAYPLWPSERDSADVAGPRNFARDRAKVAVKQELEAVAALGSVHQLGDVDYRGFMDKLNEFAAMHGMRVYRDWSKIWEYPWLWFHGLKHLPWQNVTLLDLGSEISPMPWFLALLGARVRLIEADAQWVPRWTEWRRVLNVNVDWHIVGSESLPVPDAWADVVTSFSVIEHQPGKAAAIEEVVRVLKPAGVFAISFDICEPDLGMTFPAWNGTALTIREFEQLVWGNPAFGNRVPPMWNREDMRPFLQWHLQSAPHHNYVVGAAILKKTPSAFSKNLTQPHGCDLGCGCRTGTGTGKRHDSDARAELTARFADRVFWCHYDDPGNLGDHVCCPIDYANLPGVRFDLRQPIGQVDAAALIFGGGGLLHGGTIEQIRRLGSHGRIRNPQLRLIAWGLGANELGASTLTYPDFFQDFDLVGIRDYGNPWNYVPCPSCLHPVFDDPHGSPSHEFVVYEHYDVPITGLPPAPRMTNRGDRGRLPDVVSFLAQGEYVITNSFHGAYWGLLLGRKVIVFRPFANRFLGFARPIQFCDETDWRVKMRRCVRHEDYLSECQSINRQFRTRVQALLKDSLADAHLAASAVRETPVRVKHLTSIRDALAAYHQRGGKYPESTRGWDGLYTIWGNSTPDWITGLVPDYLPDLPRDPRNHSNPNEQYLYQSDGRDFKLIAHAPEDYTHVTVRDPALIDPARQGWAYGFWTSGAVWW